MPLKDKTPSKGVFANAFRVAEGPPSDPSKCLLEFLVYSQVDDLAHVVSKVLVPPSLVPVIRSKITEVL